MSRSPNYKIANGYIQDKTTGKKVGHAVLNRHQLNTTNEGISGAQAFKSTWLLNYILVVQTIMV